jgi:hypothetical protein
MESDEFWKEKDVENNIEMVFMVFGTEEGKWKQMAEYHKEWETFNVNSFKISAFNSVALLIDTWQVNFLKPNLISLTRQN